MKSWPLTSAVLGAIALCLAISHSLAQVAAPTDKPPPGLSSAPQREPEPNFTVRQAPSGGPQEVIPLAERVDNAAANPPVDKSRAETGR
jgi:hypothetical protein